MAKAEFLKDEMEFEAALGGESVLVLDCTAS